MTSLTVGGEGIVEKAKSDAVFRERLFQEVLLYHGDEAKRRTFNGALFDGLQKEFPFQLESYGSDYLLEAYRNSSWEQLLNRDVCSKYVDFLKEKTPTWLDSTLAIWFKSYSSSSF